MAASKSRQKKKQLMQELEDTKADFEKRRRALQGNYIALLEEMSEVKNQLTAHSGCHDINIYLSMAFHRLALYDLLVVRTMCLWHLHAAEAVA